jgi:hypothetical protein
MNARTIIAFVAILIIALVFVGQNRQSYDDATLWTPGDFVEYWAAAKLALAGKNPYDPALLLPLEHSAGQEADVAVMMWNPPWSLAIVLPLGLFPAREAQLIWLAVNLLALGFSADRLWILFGGSRETRWVSWLVVFAALPTALALQWGQIGPLLLLGAVLFLECQRRGWQCCAGAATVLLAIKPQLAYLVWVAIGVDAVSQGRWRVIAGGIIAGLACISISLVFDLRLLHQYFDAIGNRPPVEWATPTIGTALRFVFGQHLFRLQFIPMTFGLAWFARRPWSFTSAGSAGKRWDWREELPLLLLVSFLTAPYGAWPFDMVLLLPVTIWLMLRTERPARGFIVAGLIMVNLGFFAVHLYTNSSFWFLWVSPAILLLYLLAQGFRPSASGQATSPVRARDHVLASP